MVRHNDLLGREGVRQALPPSDQSLVEFEDEAHGEPLHWRCTLSEGHIGKFNTDRQQVGSRLDHESVLGGRAGQAERIPNPQLAVPVRVLMRIGER